MIAPFFIAGFDTPSDLCCRIRLYNKGLCPLTPEFIALGFRRSKKEQHQVLLLQTSNNNYGWYQYHAGIFGEVNSTPYPCKSKFQSEVWDNWNLFFQLTYFGNSPLYTFQDNLLFFPSHPPPPRHAPLDSASLHLAVRLSPYKSKNNKTIG